MSAGLMCQAAGKRARLTGTTTFSTDGARAERTTLHECRAGSGHASAPGAGAAMRPSSDQPDGAALRQAHDSAWGSSGAAARHIMPALDESQ